MSQESLDPAQTTLPRWRGFNLLEMFRSTGSRPDQATGDFREDDFRWIRDWSFDFIRIPIDYHLIVRDEEHGDLSRPEEAMLAKLDRAVDLGERYGVHVDLNLHTAPGFCVRLGRPEPYNLWKDPAAQDAFCALWARLARRYRGRPSERLSFNLVNEPPAPAAQDAPPDQRYPRVVEPADPQKGVWNMTRADHERVVRAATAAIREQDPGRLVIADGVRTGNEPCPELADLGIGQSCRAYRPSGVTFYRTFFADPGDKLPEPTWPLPASHPNGAFDRAALEAHFRPWADLARQGVGVHCGEGGVYHKTPHNVALAWLRDTLDVLMGYGIGYAQWMLRGPFGILDSERADVAYEDWHGHALDRRMLETLQQF